MVGYNSRSRSTSRSPSQYTSQSRNHRRSSRSRERFSQRSNPDSEYRSSHNRSRRSISPSRNHSPSSRGRDNIHPDRRDNIHPDRRDNIHPDRRDNIHTDRKNNIHPDRRGNIHPERSQNISSEAKDFSRDYNRAKENTTRGFTRPTNIGNGDEFFKSRREERSVSSLTFWPDSDQISSTSEESDHKSKRSKRGLGANSEAYSKSKKSKSKKKEKSHKSKKSYRRSESPNYVPKRKYSNSISTSDNIISQHNPHITTSISISDKEYAEERWPEKKVYFEESAIGPTPAPVVDQKIDSRSYGSALLAGEAEAMAAYIQSGKRIPRRGEIGLKSDQIEMFEQQGFVMSGSRHQRMNAVRIRKENQIISAEEKRALLNLAQEEHAKRENKIIADLREMVSANRSEE